MCSALGNAAFQQNPIPTLLCDADARILDANAAYLAMSRRSRAELIGMSSIELIHAEDLPGAALAVNEAECGAAAVRNRRRHMRPDGSAVEIEALLSFIHLNGRRVLLCQIVDVGDEVEVDSRDEELTRLNNDQFGDISAVHDADGRVVFTTLSFEAPFGLEPGWFRGRLFSDPALDPQTLERATLESIDDPVRQAIATGEPVTQTMGLRNADGELMWFSARIVPNAGGRYAARSTLRDVSDLIAAQDRAAYLAEIMERELTHRADHDSLTGLKARHVVNATLEARVESGEPTSVVFVDLDEFKAVNDTEGHVVGDEVLVAASQRLSELGHEALIVSRTGGDEFLALFDDAPAAGRFAEAVSAASLTAAPLPPLGASVGVSHSLAGDTARDLIARADAEMYVAKRRAMCERTDALEMNP